MPNSSEIRPITNEEYCQESSHCIHCKGYNIEGGSIDLDSNYATQQITCNTCGAEWEDTYILTGYDCFTPPKDA